MSLKTAIIKTIHYSDIFDYPLKIEEISERLIGMKATPSQIKKSLSEIPGMATKSNYYFLKGREKLVDVRERREKISAQKLKKVQAGANLLRLVPWIKFVGVTGSVAAGNAANDDDIDL